MLMQKRGRTREPSGASGEPASIGIVATRIAAELARGDAIFVARDDHRAELVAAALMGAAPEAEVLLLPSSDALPGDRERASPANIGRRVAALRAVRRALACGVRERPVALVTTAELAARLQRPPAAYDAIPPAVAVGSGIDVEALAQELERIGYIADERVDEPGEIAVRGQVVDIFPADSIRPARIEIDENGAIREIRLYDPVTQRTVESIGRLEMGRVREPDAAADTPVFAHLPDAAVLLDLGVETRRDRYAAMARDAGRAGGSPESVLAAGEWERALNGRRIFRVDGEGCEPVRRFVEAGAPARALARQAVPLLDGGGKLVLAGSVRDLRFLSRRVARALKREAEPVESWAAVGKAGRGALLTLAMPIDRGWREGDLMVVAAADLIGSRAEVAERLPEIDPLMGPASEIRIGDVVVHEEFGLGVVEGLERVEGTGDAIALRYADEGRRLVPIMEAERIWRYGADADAVTLDRLDGSSWDKRRGEIDAAIAESARALVRIAAERDRRSAPVIAPDPAAYERFAAGFPFTESADQARAIAAVRADLASGKPMDRLVVGDVGYGKTEVALRAAALTALAGRQVVVAAPTTVLVRQHLETFRKRFEGSGIVVEGLSRLSGDAEKRAVKKGLADGSIHIVIGTGAVAARGVRYKDLALVVIDEEQRFGAADKTKLRALGGGSNHVLVLSATPIPRTLQTALVGLQQLSIIATPPARRQPIRTSMAPFDATSVRTALRREAARGGQSFVVVPRIEDMEPMAQRLAQLVPELSVLRAHGKMPVAGIDDAMIRFAKGEGDVLLATNIIEAGLDVPRANTMIVWRADRFGLSQLHQLRGRVGRGSRRGQVLLTTDPDARIAPATVKRLRTLEAFDRLGAGFAISARDLDLRGAGDLVGESQAGHMKLIGVELYQFLLGAALKAARGERVERWTPELNLGVEGRLPEEWIPEPELRITLYVRLARIGDEGALEALADELEDRFGPLPPEAERLMALVRVRVAAAGLGIARIDAGPGAIALTPRKDLNADPETAGLERKGERWVLAERIEDPGQRLERTANLLVALAGD